MPPEDNHVRRPIGLGIDAQPRYPGRMRLLLIILWLAAETWSIAWTSERLGGVQVFVLWLLVAATGLHLIQRQGLKTMAEIQAAMQREQLPALAMLDGLIVFISGLLLIVPGFFSDAVALFLLIGGPRRQLASQAEAHLRRRHPDFHRPTVIEGEFIQVEEHRQLEHDDRSSR